MKTRLTLLALALITLISVNSNAQSKHKYMGEIDFGYSAGTNSEPFDRFNFSTTHGVLVNKYISVGVGIGLDLYDIEDHVELLMPIYANLTGYLSDYGTIKPYMSVDLGYGIGLSEDFENLDGIYFTPAIGIKVNAFKFQMGYSSQRFKEEEAKWNIGAMQLKIGYTF